MVINSINKFNLTEDVRRSIASHGKNQKNVIDLANISNNKPENITAGANIQVVEIEDDELLPK